MGCLDAKEGGRVPGVDLKAESKRKTEWGVWKKNGVSVSWEDTMEERRESPLHGPNQFDGQQQ